MKDKKKLEVLLKVKARDARRDRRVIERSMR